MANRVITTLTALAVAAIGYAGPAAAQPVLADETKANPKGTRLPARPTTERELLRLAQPVIMDDTRADPRKPARPEAEPTLVRQA